LESCHSQSLKAYFPTADPVVCSFEDVLFNASNDMQESPVVMAIFPSAKENERLVGMAFVDMTKRLIGATEFPDDDQYTNLESAIVALGCKECVLPQVSLLLRSWPCMPFLLASRSFHILPPSLLPTVYRKGALSMAIKPPCLVLGDRVLHRKLKGFLMVEGRAASQVRQSGVKQRS
jgi:hypothetical protein